MFAQSQILHESLTHADIPATAPDAATVGCDISSLPGAAKPINWLITITVTVAPSDVFLWGQVAAGVAGSAADDVWGLHNGRYGQHAGGKLGTALAIGTHHFVVEDLGVYRRIAFQKSAGTVSVVARPIALAGH